MTEQKRDHQVRAYERMLDRLRGAMDHLRLREAIEAVKERAVELGELTREEADRIGGFLQRDVEEAAQYSAQTDEDLSSWLRMDLQLVESWIWDRFASVADKTRLEWLELQHELQEWSEYHTGEIAGPGSLTCKNCGEIVHFKQAGHIPPCPKCRGSVYLRTPAHEAGGSGEE